MRQRVGNAGQLLLDDARDRQFVGAVGDRPQQADRHRLELALLQRAHHLARLVLVERRDDVALRVDALGDLESVAARDVGRRIVVAVVVRVVLAALLEHQNVGEAVRGEERGLAVDWVTIAFVARVVP